MTRDTPKTAGQRLVSELSRRGDPYEITLMVTEAGRIADRLNDLNDLLIGKKSAWLQVRVNTDQVVVVQVTEPLKEARQQSGALVRLLSQIHRQRANIPGPDPDDDLADL
jgi:hypothetical protein